MSCHSTQGILTVLATVPEFTGGEFLFSLAGGRAPVWVGSKVKDRLDKAMLRTLRARARQHGEDATKVALPHFTNHDVRAKRPVGSIGAEK